MNRKRFVAALGIITGGVLTGFGSSFRREMASETAFPVEGEGDIWETVREEFSFPEGYVFLNTGGIGSVPRHVRSLLSDEWILAPRRTGVLYVTKEKLDNVAPVTVGDYSDNGYDFAERRLDFHPTSQRFEYGTQNELLFLGFHASLKIMNSLGIKKVREHNEYFSEMCGSIRPLKN